jgi:hypothetical protein
MRFPSIPKMPSGANAFEISDIQEEEIASRSQQSNQNLAMSRMLHCVRQLAAVSIRQGHASHWCERSWLRQCMPSFELLSILDFVNCTDEAKALGSYMELLTNSQTVLLADWQIERGIPIRTLKLNEQKAVVEFGNAGDRKDEAHHVSPWINRPTISPMEQDPACPVLDTSFRYAPMPACGEPFVMPISTRPAAYPAFATAANSSRAFRPSRHPGFSFAIRTTNRSVSSSTLGRPPEFAKLRSVELAGD